MDEQPKQPFLSNIVKGTARVESPNGMQTVTETTVNPVDSEWMKTLHLKMHRGTSKRDP